MHGYMESFCQIHHIWWSCGEGGEMRQLSELLYKKGCPVGKAPTAKWENEPLAVSPSCFTPVHWWKPEWHIHAHYLGKRRDMSICSFSRQPRQSHPSTYYLLTKVCLLMPTYVLGHGGTTKSFHSRDYKETNKSDKSKSKISYYIYVHFKKDALLCLILTSAYLGCRQCAHKELCPKSEYIRRWFKFPDPVFRL